MTDLRERVARAIYRSVYENFEPKYLEAEAWQEWLDEADAAIAAILPPSWRIVPEEPTEEMLKATIYSVATKQQHLESRVDLRPTIWRVMLAAAPIPAAAAAAAEEKHDG